MSVALVISVVSSAASCFGCIVREENLLSVALMGPLDLKTLRLQDLHKVFCIYSGVLGYVELVHNGLGVKAGDDHHLLLLAFMETWMLF